MSRQSSARPEAGGPRIAVLAMNAIGHVNPMLALVDALVAHGRRPDVRVFAGSLLAPLITGAGAAFEERRAPAADRGPGTGVSTLARRSFLAPQDGLADIVRRVGGFGPQIIVHDVFDLCGKIAAHALGVPAAAVLPFAGLRALGPEFVAQHGGHTPEVLRANDRMSSDFGIDVLADSACLPVLFPSRDLSMVTAIEEQSPGKDAGTARLTRIEESLGQALSWLGPWLGETHWCGDPGTFAWDQVRRARSAGRQIVLLSLGTNLMTFRRREPMGGAPSGEAFARTAAALLQAAFRDDLRAQLVVATGDCRGRQADRWPPGTVLAPAVPQRTLLADGVDAFVSHHGYNSVAEAVLTRTPMVAFPGYGDQITNARFCLDRGVSVAYWDLCRSAATCQPRTLRQAVRQAASGELAAALGSLRRDLLTGGGARRGAELVLQLAGG